MGHTGAPEHAGMREPAEPREQAGLRERSKARRRAAIIRAALELFTERGYDATTIADIAAAADVAPRTVAMYFPSKQDIAMARFSEQAAELTSALRSRGPGESGTAIIDRWLRARGQLPEAEQELRELSARMFAANPELNALRTARMATVIAQDTGVAPGDAGPRIAALATAAIVLEVECIPPGDRRDRAITTAMRFLDAGFAALMPDRQPTSLSRASHTPNSARGTDEVNAPRAGSDQIGVIWPSLQVSGSYSERGRRVRVRRHDRGRFFSEVPRRTCALQIHEFSAAGSGHRSRERFFSGAHRSRPDRQCARSTSPAGASNHAAPRVGITSGLVDVAS